MSIWIHALAVALSLSAPHDLSRIVESEGVDPGSSTLLIVRLEDGVEWTSGGSRMDTPYSPASTSKIPHTLIALETGYADSPDTRFEWDGVNRFIECDGVKIFREVASRDQTLASAFKHSVVWAYQEITRSLGHATMSEWMDRFEYGNRNIGAPTDITTYWLKGPLAISARDQVRFLGALVEETLPLTAETMRFGKQIMQMDSGEGWTLYAKTGWHGDDEGVDIGWYVGWVHTVENDLDQTYVFAFNMDMVNPTTALSKREAVVRSALTQLGAIPSQTAGQT